MKLTRLVNTTLLAALLLACLAPAARAQGEKHREQGGHERGMKEHSFGVAQFDRFHDLLHPLQHEALPGRDFKTIRAKAAALYAAGRAAANAPVPRGVADRQAYRQQSAKFLKALGSFRRATRPGASASDEAVSAAFSRVHDEFEALAHMLPRNESR